ncbi:telomerase-binding protein EST1A-like isoform X2 [Varroa jacobsoni]|uniref:telomerase-binding protein EST1A-like isoform X2 n=1 Tax=Varroa jacobsoni TaxID=62625 RepID=UPI000BFA3CE5|nr:telomerase-binding protein EST1A-like isoform X2 [Varroa jacobsoni]
MSIMGDSTEPDGGGTSGGTGRRRRNTKQDRALYQPGKGLGGGSRGSPAPSTGSNQGDRGDPMDAVQQKLQEMSMRGPPFPGMRRGGRGGRGQGELWRPEKLDNSSNNNHNNRTGGNDSSNNRGGGGGGGGQQNESTRWKSDRRVSPSDRWRSNGNDESSRTLRGSIKDLTAGTGNGNDGAGDRGDRSVERARRDSNCSQMSVASSGGPGNSSNGRVSSNWRGRNVAGRNGQNRQQQDNRRAGGGRNPNNNNNNSVGREDDSGRGPGQDEELSWQKQGVVPPRGNVSGRQLWVDESSEKNDYKAGGSWRSGSQGDNATGRQGEKSCTGSNGNDVNGSDGGKGRRRDSRRERRSRGRGPLERRRPDDLLDDDTPDQDEEEDPQDADPSHDEAAATEKPLSTAASAEEESFSIQDDRKVASQEIQEKPNGSESHEQLQESAPKQTETGTQKTQEQSNQLEVALCDANASADPTGEKQVPLQFVDPEDDDDNELISLQLPGEQENGPVARLDWTECPTPPPLEELESHQEEIQPVYQMDRECGDRNGRNMSPITRASMVHRGYDDFAGRGNAASYEVDRPHSTQMAQSSDSWIGGRRRLDSDASSSFSQYSGRSYNQPGGGRRDRRMSERSAGGGRYDRGSRRDSPSSSRRSPDFNRDRGDKRDWNRERAESRNSHQSGDQKRYGGFQADTLPPRFLKQREEEMRLQQQQLDRQMLIEQMQRQKREEKEARERQRKEQVQLLQRQRDQQQIAARERASEQQTSRTKPVEVENWRRRDHLPANSQKAKDNVGNDKGDRPQASSASTSPRTMPAVDRHIRNNNNNISNHSSNKSNAAGHNNNAGNSNGASGGRNLNTNWRSSASGSNMAGSRNPPRDPLPREIWTRNSAAPASAIEKRGSGGTNQRDDRHRDNRRGDGKDSRLGFDRDSDKNCDSSNSRDGGRGSVKHGRDMKDFQDRDYKDAGGGQRNAKEIDQRQRDIKGAGGGSNKPLMSVRPVPQVREDARERGGGIHRNLKGAAEKNLAEGADLEKELAANLVDAVKVGGGVKRLTELRAKIQRRYEHIILHDPRYSTEKNVEQMLWKSVYHQVIEGLRRECVDHGGSRASIEIRGEICAIVEEGLTFYESLLEGMQELHGFRLDQSSHTSLGDSYAGDSNGSRGSKHGPPNSTPVKILLVSAQKMLISLGDLCRYREQALESANFARARDFYLRAQQLAPKNGKPYNQLALLAVYSRRKLDAVYYYMRSLAASNPFLSAKESLTTLFDEVRKSCEAIDRQRKIQKGLQDNTRTKAHMALPELARCEIWIRPDGSSWQRRGDSELEQKLELLEEINALSDFDLTKRFTLSFLHVHGKLFSKIGMEHFGETAAQMLLELRTLLRRPQTPGAGARFLQLLAICMFSIANNSLKNTATLASNARSLMQELSVQVAMSLVAHIMEFCTERIEEHLRCRTSKDPGCYEAAKRDEEHLPVDEQINYPLLPPDVEELLSVLKVWTDWMSGTKMLWCPPPNPCEFATHTKCGDIWSSLAELLTALMRADSAHVGQMAPEFTTCRTLAQSMEVLLPEDSALAGFVPLLGSPVDTFFAAPVPASQIGALRTALRISRLHFFGDYLCGLTPSPYLHFDVRRSAYGSLLPEAGDDGGQTEELIAGADDIGLDEEDDEPAYESQTGSDDPSDDDAVVALEGDDQLGQAGVAGGSGEMEKLRRKKHLLQKRVKRHNRVQAYIERVLHSSRVGTTILEIRPRFLIPDTNCLVDHLDKVRALVACKTYSIYIPIIVVSELDGLARGCMSNARTHQTPAHAARVTTFAREALGYLENRFTRREPKLRTITSRGNLIDSISFRTEVGNDLAGVTNDDLILSCAVSLGKSSASGGELNGGLSLVGGSQTSGAGHSLQPGETEAPLRLFREAVLLTEDRNLAVKAMAHNVPVRDIVSFVRWAQLPPVDEDI